MTVKGLIILGEFSKVTCRQKSTESLEIGELLIADTQNSKVLLQVTDLLYGSQVSRQSLELISGISLEENSPVEFYDENLRNYNLANLKSLISISGDKARLNKELPKFLSEVRDIKSEDLSFLTRPLNPLYIGKLRSGSKTLDVGIFLPGKKVFSHHILIPATTGRGKSLDENEEVLLKTNNIFSIKSIGELVENNSNFQDSRVVSMNPKNYSTDFKKIIKFVKHKAPPFMYRVTTESGREVTVTEDHNLYAMSNGKLQLLRTKDITDDCYLPLPLRIATSGKLKVLNLLDLLKNFENIFVIVDKKIIDKLKSKDFCLRILSKNFTNPMQKYRDILKSNRMRIPLFHELISKPLTYRDLKFIELTDLHGSVRLPALFSLSEELLELIGLYIAEGYCFNDNSFRISCSEKKLQKRLTHILKKIGLKHFWIQKKEKNVDVGISSSIFTKIIKKIGLGNVSGNKRLPNFYMNLSNKDLSVLLRAYFEGDGGVDREINKRNTRFKISATTKSKKLASDICLALYRFGILARCKSRIQRAMNTNHKGDQYYRISISGQTDLSNFLSEIGFQSLRKNSILAGRLNYRRNTNVAVIPLDPHDFKIRRLQTKLSQKQFARRANCSQQIISLIELGKRRPSRDLFSKILLKFKNFHDLSYLINFRWDKIREISKYKYNKKHVYDLTIADNNTFLAGHGGLFVHNSNLTSCILWNCTDKDYCGILVLDPHDEYYGRNRTGLKDHQKKENVVYYTPNSPPPGTNSLRINLEVIKPTHFNGVSNWSPPQRQAMTMYYRRYGKKWIESIMMDKQLDDSQKYFHDGTIAVIKRRLLSLLDLDWNGQQLFCNGIFTLTGGDTTISDICSHLESSKTVIVDTSSFGGAAEILIGSLISTEIFNRYKQYKLAGKLKDKPVINIILEEAPRVLGKEVLEQGSNIFATIAREGRKFNVGLTAITQLPSLIPRQILANMNTKIILGLEMAPERQAIIDSASQDLSDDSRNIASLDIGEAIITSNFSKFATPVKIPLFDDVVKESKEKGSKVRNSFSGMNLA